jgi:hypothetical protein
MSLKGDEFPYQNHIDRPAVQDSRAFVTIITARKASDCHHSSLSRATGDVATGRRGAAKPKE